MFNYWTEGGATAFGQEPDPETGKTPLQLFMDGRAQAAYDHDKFQLWNYIRRGGHIADSVRLARRNPTSDDYVKIGKWLDNQMKKEDVWVIMMPTSQVVDPRNNTFALSLQKNDNWQVAYMDNYQYIFVNINTTKGNKLMSNVLSQRARFPNELSKNLTLARNFLRAQDAQQSMFGLNYAVKALQIDPSQTSMMELMYAARRKNLKKAATAHTKEYFDKFIDNKDTWSKQGGYEKRLVAATVAARYLATQGRPELRKRYSKLADEYTKERSRISQMARW